MDNKENNKEWGLLKKEENVEIITRDHIVNLNITNIKESLLKFQMNHLR